MSRSWFASVALLAVAAALFLTPDTSQAQRRGGWGRGSWGGGWNRGWDGGWNRGWGIGIGFGYPSYGWASPGYYRYWDGYGYSSPTYSSYYYPTYGSFDYSYPQYTYGSGYSPSYSYGSQPSYSADVNRTKRDEMKALVDVRVPQADATVTINGKPTEQRGTVRKFETPPLNSGDSYQTTFRASWMENGNEVHRTKTVTVRPGAHLTVDFDRSTSENQDQNKGPEPSSGDRSH